MPEFFAHETAVVEPGAKVGKGTKVWHHAHIRDGAAVGDNCIISMSVYVDSGAKVGSNVKIQNNTSIYRGCTVEDGAFIGPSVVLTNDKMPRATNVDGSLKEACNWSVGETVIGRGASIGAGSVILPDIKIGEFSMVGAGSVVTKDVPPHALVAGNPARIIGYVCRCGRRVESCRPLICDKCKNSARL